MSGRSLRARTNLLRPLLWLGLVALSTTWALARPATVAQGATTVLPRLGMMGPYSAATEQSMRAAGVTDALVEMSWAQAEPSPGTYDTTYLAGIRQQKQDLQAAGFRVALNDGLADAPAWILSQSGAQFVDQDGVTFAAATTPNLIFDTALRAHAQQYLNEVFSLLGTDFSLVRAGGGPLGELSYPYLLGSNGLVANDYWAFDVNALAGDPVPGWRPGDPSPDGEASSFLNWYLDSLVKFQNWQISAIRIAGYSGSVAVLYPSFGMRPGDFSSAVKTNLAGTSSPEINGEVQRGYDFARQVTALTDPGVIVYSTWAEATAPVQYLATLATNVGLPFMAENSGGNSRAQIATALQDTAAAHGIALFLVRAPQFLCSCDGLATMDDVRAAYAGLTNNEGATATPPATATPSVLPVPTPSVSAPASTPVVTGVAGATNSIAGPPRVVTTPLNRVKAKLEIKVQRHLAPDTSRTWTGTIDVTSVPLTSTSYPTGALRVIVHTPRGTQSQQVALAAVGSKLKLHLQLPARAGRCTLVIVYSGDTNFNALTMAPQLIRH